MDSVELVVVGKCGSGKSSFLEALLDIPFAVSRKDRGTLRPVHLNLINNQDCPEPRVTIKRDGFMEEFNRETVVSDLSKLSDAVAERTVDTEIPIYLNVEWRYTWNITIIDTPGLLDPEDVQDDPVDRELLSLNTLELMRKPERIIIAVEDTDVEGGFKMADFVRQVDPALDRTIFVMTKLDKALEVVVQAGGSVALNDYFGRSPRQQTSFWCSFPWGRARSKYNTRDLLLEKTVQMTDADMRALEELQYDRRFLNQFGVRSVRSFLVQLIWRRYQESIPQVLKALQQNKQAAHSELSRVSNMIANLEPYKLRAAASNYVMQFLQTVEKVISGTLSGNPGLNGLTMAQEHSDEQAGPWIDASHQVISFDPDDLGISNAEARLYGGQQFARLLAEFRAVSHTLSVGSFSVSEIATAAGPSKINNTSNMAWAASDLAQKRCQRALMPLVDQLYRRAVFVLGRLADIVEDMIEKQAKQDRAAAADHAGFGGLSGMPSSGFGVASVLQAQIIPVEEYPYFVQHVKAQYREFVAHAAENCAAKCLDEFYCTRIVYWDLNSRKEAIPDLSGASEEKAAAAVTEFAGKLFAELRDRVVENVLLKCHNFFLVPMQTELWGDIQAKVTQLDDQSIAEMFQVVATRERFKRNEDKLRSDVKKLQEQETLLNSCANSFAHPN